MVTLEQDPPSVQLLLVPKQAGLGEGDTAQVSRGLGTPPGAVGTRGELGWALQSLGEM